MWSPAEINVEDQEKFKKALMKFYLKKKPTKEPKDANDFAQFILQMLGKINEDCEGNPLEILTLSYNLQDGIGDFVNQVDFTSWLHEVFDRYNHIQIKALSIVESGKFNVAQRLMPDNVKKAGVVTVKEEKELANVKDTTSNVLLSYEVGSTSLESSVIKNIVGSAEYVINLARYIHFHKELGELLSQCNPKAFVQSRGEYGPLPDMPYGSEKIVDKKIYYETCMGAEATTTGLKFYPNIEALSNRDISDLEKSKLMDQFENTKLRNALITTNSLEYMQTHGFAFGYIQDKFYSILFSRLMIAKASQKEKGVTMIVNLSHFDDIKSNKEFMSQLKQQGFSQIRMIANDGVEKSPITIEGGVGEKVLTLVEFRGSSQPDKEKMIAMSDMVAGSGNSSFSEMLSSRRFPFIQPIHHVYMFYLSFIKEIPGHISNRELLTLFLTLNITPKLKEQDIQELIRIVSNPELVDKIQQAWVEYCNFLEEHRNAYDDFAELICAFTVIKMMELYGLDACNQLETQFASGMQSLAGTTFLHMAIEKGLTAVAIQLINTHPELINTTCIHRDYTPVMMAARYKQYGLVELMISNGALLSSKDSEGLTVAHHAVITKDLQLFTLLFKYNSSLFTQKNRDGKTPLDYLSSEDALEFIAPLLGKNKNEVNYVDVANFAIQHNSEHLFQMACRHTAAKERSTLLQCITNNYEKAHIYLPIYLFTIKEPVDFKVLHSTISSSMNKMFPESEFKKLKLKDYREQADLQLSLIHLSNLYTKVSAEGNIVSVRQFIDSGASHLFTTKKNPAANEAMWKLSWLCYEKTLHDYSDTITDEVTLPKLQRDLLVSKIFFYLNQHMVNCQRQATSGIFNYLPGFISPKQDYEKKITTEREKVEKIKDILRDADSPAAIKHCFDNECAKYLTDSLGKFMLSKIGPELDNVGKYNVQKFG